ncbi:subclass B3 metallo-beta-lactamase [Altererythrobacter sp. ZODW24]|uniref:subclass B3 metallo-beta-lactamase n=1 Tax=Altererythrobacter sp. ZODW24 TaxID=2185142 RepID=UPI0013B3D7A2|nr:subclass B3 metallo-beta-lactamase [Altererythrobacter sp. ZODW24]
MAKWAASCEKFDDWDKAGPPYRIYGGTYYVGTCGISAILIVGESEHILIDSGTQAGADVVLQNIEALGFSADQIGLILHSHEHFDHVGGIAKIQKASGADIAASAEAKTVIETGKNSPDDPQAGMLKDFPAATVGTTVVDGQKIEFGFNTLTTIATPGHTPGALSWRWTECEGDDCKTIVYADSMSPISNDAYRFSDDPRFVAEYRTGIARIENTACDILLSPHPSSSQMETRLIDGSVLVDNSACSRYANSVLKRLTARLVQETVNAK